MSQPSYRLVYFNTRGVVEHIRLLLAASGAQWQDVRYPMGIGAAGFTLDAQYVNDRDAGAFKVNMDQLPVCIIQEADGTSRTLGQSHAIARYIAQRHGLMGADAMQAAEIDCLYECIRDIKQQWLKVKSTPDAPDSPPGAARREAKQAWWASGLPDVCLKLEAAATAVRPDGGSPWLVGDRVSLADIGLYHALGTTTSLITGSTVSFMDNEGPNVEAAFVRACPRLVASVQAVGALPAVQAWEEQRPDTFS